VSRFTSKDKRKNTLYCEDDAYCKIERYKRNNYDEGVEDGSSDVSNPHEA